MFTFIQSYPMTFAAVLIVLDLISWNVVPYQRRLPKVAARLGAFLLYSVVIINAGNIRPSRAAI